MNDSLIDNLIVSVLSESVYKSPEIILNALHNSYAEHTYHLRIYYVRERLTEVVLSGRAMFKNGTYRLLKNPIRRKENIIITHPICPISRKN